MKFRYSLETPNIDLNLLESSKLFFHFTEEESVNKDEFYRIQDFLG